MANNKLKLAVTAVLLGSCGGVFAQSTVVRPAYQFPATPPTSGAASVQLGDTPFYVLPYVGLAAGYDDNLFLSSRNEKSSSLYVLSPGIKIDARDANKVIQLGYQAQIGRYGQSEDDDYVDQTARAQFDMAFDRRNFLRMGLDHFRNHDPRGSTDRPISGSPDRFKLTNPYASYAFGAPGAAGRVEAYYNYADKKYLNNRETTQFGDRKNEEFGGAFYWRVMPKTYLMAEARETRIGYRSPAVPLDAHERRYYGGVMWEATAATTGTIKVGNLKRRFDSEVGLADFSGTSWEGLVTWAPRTYSKFDFYTARQTNESTGLGDFILSSIAGVAWNHSWSSVLSTGVDYRYQKDEYQGFDRSDKTNILGLRVGYKFRRWLTLGAEFAHAQRDSNLPLFEYDKNLYLLTATASM
jgi:hypothetical protein